MEGIEFVFIKIEMRGWLYEIIYVKEGGIIFIILCWGFIDDLMIDIGRIKDDGVNVLKFS